MEKSGKGQEPVESIIKHEKNCIKTKPPLPIPLPGDYTGFFGLQAKRIREEWKKGNK